MRILIVGAGAVGGYFGARLAAAGRDVTFLVRSERAARLRADGLVVRSPAGDVDLQPVVVERDALDGPYDVILLTVKAYGLESALDDLAPAVGPRTMIIPTLNGMAHLDRLRERFGPDRVLGGSCVIAAQLDADQAVRHLGMDPSLRFGEWDGSSTARVAQVQEAFSVPGFSVSTSTRIVADLWEKWVFLGSAAASTCLLRGSVGQIVAAGGAATVAAIIDEATAVASHAGHRPRPESEERTRALLTAAGSTFTASMYRDLQEGRPIERAQIIGDLVDRAHAAGLDVPLLAAANTALTIYEKTRGQDRSPEAGTPTGGVTVSRPG